MTRARALWAAALALSCASPAFAAKPFPPPPRDWVHNENVLSPSAERALSETLETLHRSTGRQFVVAAFRSLEGESLEDWTNRLFRAWKIGDEKRDDGLLFCVFVDDRKWRVEVGFGLEGVVTDLQASRAAREAGTPRFKQGDYDGGTLAVAQELSAILRGEHPAPPPEDPRRGADASGRQALIWLLLIVFWALSSLPRRRRYYLGGGGWSSGWGGGGGGGGFSGGGGSSGGGGASGGW